ncbi:hypothetical protein NEHOM01_0701 [Nematocida homosporus]|uniref:uncharacterized protein n=1 Tax=Nematocida homosporus TaxID=1912981 RepID=UPI00221FC6B2|nr:uncharacterized protein NEHOM01_0701 [Nematocida homosporus]KAI5185243.1 hypothetical protein NEHOM01_0701 [Nematocida homosporus]
MIIETAAEYAIPGQFLLSTDCFLLVYAVNAGVATVSLYTYPAQLHKRVVLMACPSLTDIEASWDPETKQIDILVQTTRERAYFVCGNLICPHKDHYLEGSVWVKNCSETKAPRPCIYSHGQKICTLRDPVDAFYYDSLDMALYTFANERVTKYTLFSIEKVQPRGVCLLSPERMRVFLPGKQYSMPIQYSLATIASIRDNNGAIDALLSCNDLVMHGNQFKKYPSGFSPDKAWNTPTLIYLHSSYTRQLVVLNRGLEIEYELVVENVFVTEKYVFISKKDKCVVHYTADFKYAFYLTGLEISDEVIDIEAKENVLSVLMQKRLAKKGTPLFSLFLSEFGLPEKKKRLRIPVLVETASLYGTTVYTLSEEKKSSLFITTGLRDVSTARTPKESLTLGLAGSFILVLFRETLLSFPVAAVESPFFWTNKTALQGAPIRVYATAGSIELLSDKLTTVCFFPVLIMLHCKGLIPGDLLFDLYATQPEFVTSLEKTLFHFLNTDDIDGALDLLDSIKSHSSGIFEETVSAMIRLLDETNLEKLYAIFSAEDAKAFKDPLALSRVLLHDSSLFPKFLDASIQQKKESRVIEVISFFAKLSLPTFHEEMLSLLLQRNMFYAAGFLLSNTQDTLQASIDWPASPDTSNLAKPTLTTTNNTTTTNDNTATTTTSNNTTTTSTNNTATTPTTNDNTITTTTNNTTTNDNTTTNNTNNTNLMSSELALRGTLLQRFIEVERAITRIKASSQVAEELEYLLFTDKDSLFVAMLCERLNLLDGSGE